MKSLCPEDVTEEVVGCITTQFTSTSSLFSTMEFVTVKYTKICCETGQENIFMTRKYHVCLFDIKFIRQDQKQQRIGEAC